jgi:hypothetical protein
LRADTNILFSPFELNDFTRTSGPAAVSRRFEKNWVSFMDQRFGWTHCGTDYLAAVLDDGNDVGTFDRHRALGIAGDAQGLGQVVLGDPLCSSAVAHWTGFWPSWIDTAGIISRATALLAVRLGFKDAGRTK